MDSPISKPLSRLYSQLRALLVAGEESARVAISVMPRCSALSRMVPPAKVISTVTSPFLKSMKR